MRDWLPVVVVIVASITGCEEVHRIEKGNGGAPDPVLQGGAVHSRISPGGLATLFEVVHPEGLEVEAESREYDYRGDTLTFGPVAQTAPLTTTDVDAGATGLDIALTAEDVSLTIPVRVDQGASVRICQFRVAGDELVASAAARPDPDRAWAFRLPAEPEILTSPRQVESIGSCPPLVDDDGEAIDRLENWLGEYFGEALRRGIDDYVAISLIDELGLPRGSTALRHLSPFTNRQGVLRYASYASREERVGVDSGGSTLRLDLGLSSNRARCAPPVSLGSPDEAPPAGEVSAERLDGDRSDLGLALAKPLVGRLARAATLSGFLCRGLDDDPSQTDGRIPRQEVRLADVGLADLPATGPFESVISPGSLPETTFHPREEAIEVTWSGLSVDLYGRVADTRLRVLSLTTSASFRYRPSDASTGLLDLSLETITVEEASLQTPWAETDPEEATLERWARRLLLLVFEEAFSLPLPVAPGAPLELVGTDVRPDDLLFRLQILPR